MNCAMKRLGFNLIAMIGCFVVGLASVLALSFTQAYLKADHYPGNIPQAVTPAWKVTETQTTSYESRIRLIDFLNFTYPNKSSSYRSVQNTLELVNGDFEFYNSKEKFRWLVSAVQRNIIYADLTGDGEE